MFRRSEVEVKKERLPQLAFASLLIFVMGAGALFMRLFMGVWPTILQLRLLEGVGLLLTFVWAIVEDASADAHARVAATIALRSTGSFDRKRVDDAAKAIASPKLRVALETCAASEDEAVYEKALSEME